MSLTLASWRRYPPTPLPASIGRRLNLRNTLVNVCGLFRDKFSRMGVRLLMGLGCPLPGASAIRSGELRDNHRHPIREGLLK